MINKGGGCFSWGAAANEFHFFSIRPFFLKNIDLNKKLKFVTYIVYHSFNHFMYLLKLLVHALLILWMFVNLVNLLPTLVINFNLRICEVLGDADSDKYIFFHFSHNSYVLF